MQTFVFVLLMFNLSATAVSDSRHKAGATVTMTPIADTNSLNGQWFLQPMLSSDTAAGKIPELRFNMATHGFTGNTGCNTMRGSFNKTDTSLAFNQDIVITKMACTGYDEAAFIKSLLRTNRYKFEKGVLILMFDATELSRWTRKPDRKIKINKA